MQERGPQAPAGIPDGWIYPSFQASKIQTKSTMEKPTRNAKALAMPPEGCLPEDWPSPFIM